MEVTVSFTTQLKAALGISEQAVTLEAGATVQNAIDSLAEQYSEAPSSRYGGLITTLNA